MTDPETFIIRASGTQPFKEVPLALAGFPREEAGQPCHYLKKEIIPIGDTRRHPDAGYPIHVTPERVDRWLANFTRMSERGHAVPLQPGHKGSALRKGKWISLSREPNPRGGESLYGIAKVIGPAVRDEVLNNDVSIQTRNKLTDDHGNEYADAIEHIALTGNPALTALSGWEEIAASRDGAAPETVPVFEMTADGKADSVEPPATPQTPQPEETPMELKELRKALGLADSIPDAEVITRATERANAAKTAEDAKTAAEEKALGLSRDLDTARNELTRRPAPRTPPDAEALLDRSELTLGRIELLVEKGDIPEVLGKRLRAAVRNDKGEPNEFMLTRADGLDKRPIDWVISLLEGAKLGIQTDLKLARVAPGPHHEGYDPDRKADDGKPVTKERLIELAKMSGMNMVGLAAAAAAAK